MIAVDGGANYCREKNIFPEKIIGDMDSITPETAKFFREQDKKNVKFQKIDDQNSTDLEKALYHTDADFFFCFGFTGNYFDHEISLLHILQKNSQKRIFIFTAHQVFFVLPKSGLINVGASIYRALIAEKGRDKSTPLQKNSTHKISFYPLTPTKFLQSSGLKYPLDGLTLEQGKIIGTSNQSLPNTEKISWEIDQGCCLGFFPIGFAEQILHNLYDFPLD